MRRPPPTFTPGGTWTGGLPGQLVVPTSPPRRLTGDVQKSAVPGLLGPTGHLSGVAGPGASPLPPNPQRPTGRPCPLWEARPKTGRPGRNPKSTGHGWLANWLPSLPRSLVNQLVALPYVWVPASRPGPSGTNWSWSHGPPRERDRPRRSLTNWSLPAGVTERSPPPKPFPPCDHRPVLGLHHSLDDP